MKTYIVDSFTDKPFAGNPAGVCLVDRQADLNDNYMLQIAQELSLSETAFIRKHDDGRFAIRYFSPRMEIPLCGHATLAAAKVVLRDESLDEVVFQTIQGIQLPVTRDGAEFAMQFPAYETHAATAPPALLNALGLEGICNAVMNRETKILMLEIDSTETLLQLKPDYNALVSTHDEINGVLVTARSDGDDEYDFHSRYFWPWSGTNEDPVTGGTHTFLAPYWGERIGRNELKSFQSSARTGSMQVTVLGETVRITGDAVIVLSGQIEVSERVE